MVSEVMKKLQLQLRGRGSPPRPSLSNHLVKAEGSTSFMVLGLDCECVLTGACQCLSICAHVINALLSM